MEKQADKWSEEDQAVRPPVKRARVTLACQRCKTRKQKCDGVHPSCASCSRLEVECKYIVPLQPKPGERKQYVKALEDRVAELESYLSSAGFSVGEDHWKQQTGAGKSPPQQPPDEIDSLLSAVRDLSLSASGYYVGGTSTITLGRVLGSVVNTEIHRVPGPTRSRASPEDPVSRSVVSRSLAETMGPMFVAADVAQTLMNGYMKYIATRFPVLHSPFALDLHERRNGSLSVYETSILHLVYACGGRFLETTGEAGNYFCEKHYDAALANLDEILEYRDYRAVTYLLLLSTYCLRAPRDPGSWIYSGLGMRLCIDLGLHRHQSHLRPSLQSELEKRLFWSCYYLDREVSIALGRPMAISDHDIDVKLPFDIDEDITDEKKIFEASNKIINIPLNPPSSLTSFVHHIRLKNIESRIQHIIYRVDEPMSASPKIIQIFLKQLFYWRDSLPHENFKQEDKSSPLFDGIDDYVVSYYKCVRLLLYPQLSARPLNTQYLKLCAEACGGVCSTYKRLHHRGSLGFSPLSLQTVFLAGLTLIYCTWLSPTHAPGIDTAPLTDCSIMLYVMTERWPSARKYRDVFERIKSSVSDLLLNGRGKRGSQSSTCSTIGSQYVEPVVDQDLQERCRGLDEAFTGRHGADFTQMISKMSGEADGFWDGAVLGTSFESSLHGGVDLDGVGGEMHMPIGNGSWGMTSLPASSEDVSPEVDFKEGMVDDGESFEDFGAEWTNPGLESGFGGEFAHSWGSASRM